MMDKGSDSVDWRDAVPASVSRRMFKQTNRRGREQSSWVCLGNCALVDVKPLLAHQIASGQVLSVQPVSDASRVFVHFISVDAATAAYDKHHGAMALSCASSPSTGAVEEKESSAVDQGQQAGKKRKKKPRPKRLFLLYVEPDASFVPQQELIPAPNPPAIDPGDTADVTPQTLENVHVHQFYNQIASHFDHTRHRPWPQVKQYVEALTVGSLVADVGCGNGRYLGVNPGIGAVGCDLSDNLVRISRKKGYEVLVANALQVPYRSNLFDAAISIAVLHHFATKEHRLAAITELLRIVRPGGEVFLTAWALEQGDDSRRQFAKQDVFVPWHVPARFLGKGSFTDSNGVCGTSSQAAQQGQGLLTVPVDDKKDNDNSVTEVPSSSSGSGQTKTTHEQAPSSSSGSGQTKAPSSSGSLKGYVDAAKQTVVFHRFCHVFKQGELELLFGEAARSLAGVSVRVLRSFYDHSNWCVVVHVDKGIQ